jgi:hypothetical protein
MISKYYQENQMYKYITIIVKFDDLSNSLLHVK